LKGCARGRFAYAAAAGRRSRFRKPSSDRALSPVMAALLMASISAALALLAPMLAAQCNTWCNADFEVVEVRASGCVVDRYGNWNITLNVKNPGGSAVALVGMAVNDGEVAAYHASEPVAALTGCTTSMTLNPAFTLERGQTRAISVWIGRNGSKLSSGVAVGIKIHASTGNDYMILVTLV